jgi:hypothetical protein
MAEAIVKEAGKTEDVFDLKRTPVSDPGFEVTVKKLTPEKIEKAINAVLNLEECGRFWLL